MPAVAHIPSPEEIRAIVREELRAIVAELRAATTTGAPDDLDTAGAARVAHVKPETVRDWIKRRGLPARRAPGAKEHRILRADLEAFLATPTARRPPRGHAPVDLAAEADKILTRSRRG